MSNTFFCKLRVQDVEFKKCERYRLSVKNCIPVEPCSECVDADLWRQYQESPEPVVIEPVKFPKWKREPEQEPEPKQPKPVKPEPIVEAMSVQQKRMFKIGRKCTVCGKLIADYNQSGICSKCRSKKGASYTKRLVCMDCEKPIIDNNASGICRSCQRKGRQYHKQNRACLECGKPVSDRSKSGLCISCSAKNAFENSPSGRKYLKRKNKAEPKAQSIIVETSENQYAQPEFKPVVTVLTTTQTDHYVAVDLPAASLGAAKLAIERAFQEAERYREIRMLLQDLVDMEENRKATMENGSSAPTENNLQT